MTFFLDSGLKMSFDIKTLEGEKSLQLNKKNLAFLAANPGLFNNEVNSVFLSENQLKTLPPNLFEDCTELTFLYLNHNRLTYLPPKIFKNCKKLKYLHVENNDMKKLYLPLELNHDNFELSKDPQTEIIFYEVRGKKTIYYNSK